MRYFLLLTLIIINTSLIAQKEEAIFVTDEQPKFSGGTEALIKHIYKELKYPALAEENGIQGKVFLSVTIDKRGNVTDVRLLRGIGYGCDEEAIRIIKGLPRWTPAKSKNGKPTEVQLTIPVAFRLGS